MFPIKSRGLIKLRNMGGTAELSVHRGGLYFCLYNLGL